MPPKPAMPPDDHEGPSRQSPRCDDENPFTRCRLTQLTLLSGCTKSKFGPIIPHETQTLPVRSDSDSMETPQAPAPRGQARRTAALIKLRDILNGIISILRGGCAVGELRHVVRSVAGCWHFFAFPSSLTTVVARATHSRLVFRSRRAPLRGMSTIIFSGSHDAANQLSQALTGRRHDPGRHHRLESVDLHPARQRAVQWPEVFLWALPAVGGLNTLQMISRVGGALSILLILVGGWTLVLPVLPLRKHRPQWRRLSRQPEYRPVSR